MTLLEYSQVSLEAITANKLRSTLTTLGVTIGSPAIILLISISMGASREVTKLVEGLGSNLYMVTPARPKGAALTGTAQVSRLQLSHAERLQRETGFHVTVAPVLNNTTTVRYGREVKNGVVVSGTLPAFQEARSWRTVRGTFVQKSDVDIGRRVVVLGKTVEATLFGGGDSLKKEIDVGGEKFRVVGVMETKGQMFDLDMDNQIFIPITTAQRIYGTSALSFIFVGVPKADDIPGAMAEAKRILGLANEFYQDIGEQFRQLAEFRPAVEVVRGYFAALVPGDSSRSMNVRRQLGRNYSMDSRQAIPSTRGTMWAAYNAVTQYVDHERPSRGHTTQERDANRLNAAWLGSGAQLKAEALDKALELVTV